MDRPQRGKRTEKGVSPFSFSLSMHYQVIHHTPGRLRVRSGRCAFNHDQAYGIECRLLKQKGVYSVKATPCNGGVFILYEGTSPQAIFRTLDRLRPETLRSHEPEERAEARKLARSFFLRIAGKASSFLFCKVFLPPPLRMAKVFWNYSSYLRRGMAGLGSGRLNVAVLDAVSIGVSIGTKAYGTANSIMFLLSISDLLENYTRKKTRAALAASLSINIDRVWRVEEGGMRQVPMEQIRPGEKIRVDAGNVIPVDGTVLSGEAEVNQAAMTGESEAASKREGSVVFAGTTLETGSLVIRVDAAGDQSRINNIIALIDHSEELKARIQSRAEKLADSIVPYTLLTAGALFLFTRNISKALSVLMVDYSCAIKLATPISVISAMKEAAARKIMIKGGKFMELFAKTDTIVFDKTGTLTSACPQVTQIIPLSDCSREYILKTAACLEEHFPHSVARAVVRKALEEGLHHEEEHAEVEYIVAHGISSRLHGKKVLVGSYHFLFEDERIPLTEEQRQTIRNHARGKSNIFLAIGRRAIGMIGVSDPPRPEAAETIARLKRQGISSIIMLTGDSESAARAISRQLGITEYRSQVLPEDKARFIQQLKKSGKTVCMVGDGINDSPALSCADVSVSMKDSSDIAREVADISLLSSSLAELVVLRELSCAVLEKIERNYRFIIGFNSSLILLGMFGLITPDLSAFLHNASTVYVSARSTRRCLPPVRVPK